MGLRITRVADSLLYGGFELDGDDLEGTFDHRIWFRRFTDHGNKKSAVLNIETKEGITETVLLMHGKDAVYELEPGISIELTGINGHWAERQPYCDECGRGDRAGKRRVPQGRFGLEAPRAYQIVRDDARKK